MKENLIFLLLLCFFRNASSAKNAMELFFPTKYVKITNVAKGPALLQCWSFHDDLHTHILHKGQYLQWHFRVNALWDVTRFNCYVEFTLNNHYEPYFVAYQSHRCVTNHCQYRLTAGGHLQLYNDDHHRWERHSTYRTVQAAQNLQCKRDDCYRGIELP